MSSSGEALDLSNSNGKSLDEASNTGDSLNNNNNTEEIIGIKGVEENAHEQYLKNFKAHKPGISTEEMVNAYTEWAKEYDTDLFDGVYRGPAILASEMAKYYSMDERKKLKILDVAAGTGRVGHELSQLGFEVIDALEPSSGMLEVLRGRKIYGRTFESAIGYKPVSEIAADEYDSLAIAGGMGEGHIPVQAIHEFIRIVKPGGLIFIVMREEYLQTVEAYRDKLEPFMESVVEDGLWVKLQRSVVPNYSFNKNGVVFVYQKV